MEISEAQKRNRKRAGYVSFLKRKNLELAKEIDRYLKDHSEMNEQQQNTALKIAFDAKRCSNLSLYGQNRENADIKYFASISCKKKTCFVCNWQRQKTIRKKYWRWFKDNQYLGLVKNKAGNYSAKPLSQLMASGIEPSLTVDYDLMHLTLTVPHFADTGYRGEKYYFKQIVALYHYLRNESVLEIDGEKIKFAEIVYGGEYGVECTAGNWRKDDTGAKVYSESTNGLNIHIHSLLFVKKSYRSRNKLHRAILLEWNRLTVNTDSTRDVLTDHHRQQIAKGNTLLTQEDINGMNPKGATLIGLETIYTLDDNGSKVRSNTFGDLSMMKAVMETISYHFEPMAFDKEDRTINIPMMIDIAPNIYRLSLFAKFGCLRGEKSLNVTEKELSAVEDYDETAEMLVDESTGELIPADDYMITSPANIYAIQDKDNQLILSKSARGVIHLDVFSSRQAVDRLTQVAKASFKK